jgi:hypothetical protein
MSLKVPVGFYVEVGSEKELEDVLANNYNLSYTQKAIIAAKEVIAKKHKKTKYKDGRDYAKNVWGVSKDVFIYAKWLYKNHPAYADKLFEHGEVTLGKYTFKSVLSLKKFLADKKTVIRTPEEVEGEILKNARVFLSTVRELGVEDLPTIFKMLTKAAG